MKAPIRLFARDEAGNTARADFDYRVFPKPFKRSRIDVDDKLLDRVVPAILEGTTEVKPDGDNLAKFLVINGELRQKNNAKIASFAAQTKPELLWRGAVFHPFGNTAVESAFADHRTYIYKGKEVDQQVHLGFDLASYAGTPIVSANRGIVLFAEELGIYGNCVIIDHGMGVQSLYAHLSSIDVKAGQTVEKEQQIGRSGMTGMAGGDHLHFTMLVNGQMVNPVEWWDSHWIEDRILRKLRARRRAIRCSVVVSPPRCWPSACAAALLEAGGAQAGAAGRCQARRCRRRPRRSAAASTVEGQLPPEPADQDGRRRGLRTRPQGRPRRETFVGENGGLGNVFVYVKDGLGKYYFDVPTEPVTLDQQAACYKPHVFGVRVGQTLEFVNSDSDAAQRARAAEREPGVQLQPADPAAEGHAGSSPRRSDGAVQVRLHNWMSAYVGRARPSLLRGDQPRRDSSS